MFGLWEFLAQGKAGGSVGTITVGTLPVRKSSCKRVPVCSWGTMWGFPKIRGTILGVPIIRTIVLSGLYWGPLNLGNYHGSSQGETYMKPIEA